MVRDLLKLAAACVGALLLVGPALALEYVEVERDGKRVEVAGRVVVETQDGGLMLQARDGALWRIPPKELFSRRADDEPFEPYSREELAAKLLADLPQGFAVHNTAHYLICHDTSKAYALWCASLFERLYQAFSGFWSNRGFKLQEPEFPLVAIVFADRQAYAAFARDELGDAAGAIVGYYSLDTNRITMYDLTGISGLNPGGRGRGASAEIARVLAQPQAAATTATIVHEATHQIAYNCGLHTRHGDCPLWFSEGVAMFFETPDPRNAKGWRTIGGVNPPRLAQFRQYAARRPANSLVTLLSDDARLRNTGTALDAYAESWALTYFLLQHRGKQTVAYLDKLRPKKPLIWDTPQTRLEEFTDVFGDLETLDRDFLRFVERLR
ncbi:MAG: DUF1570 domain-containing protein [Pirellulales bacterium]|nr:DUF1570 domain-containing protein [Pirellulales bacterium]